MLVSLLMSSLAPSRVISSIRAAEAKTRSLSMSPRGLRSCAIQRDLPG